VLDLRIGQGEHGVEILAGPGVDHTTNDLDVLV
jgi:hypothetical protein